MQGKRHASFPAPFPPLFPPPSPFLFPLFPLPSGVFVSVSGLVWCVWPISLPSLLPPPSLARILTWQGFFFPMNGSVLGLAFFLFFLEDI